MEITITAPLSLDIGIHSKMKTKQQIEIWSTSSQRKEKEARKERRDKVGRKTDKGRRDKERKQRKRKVVKEKF
jgi:hypothetical protein